VIAGVNSSKAAKFVKEIESLESVQTDDWWLEFDLQKVTFVW
jgi:hypothetical protein